MTFIHSFTLAHTHTRIHPTIQPRREEIYIFHFPLNHIFSLQCSVFHVGGSSSVTGGIAILLLPLSSWHLVSGTRWMWLFIWVYDSQIGIGWVNIYSQGFCSDAVLLLKRMYTFIRILIRSLTQKNTLYLLQISFVSFICFYIQIRWISNDGEDVGGDRGWMRIEESIMEVKSFE